MSPSEYRAAKAALGLTHEELAEKLGIGWRQSMRYASGESKVHKAVAMRLRDLLERRNEEG